MPVNIRPEGWLDELRKGLVFNSPTPRQDGELRPRLLQLLSFPPDLIERFAFSLCFRGLAFSWRGEARWDADG